MFTRNFPFWKILRSLFLDDIYDIFRIIYIEKFHGLEMRLTKGSCPRNFPQITHKKCQKSVLTKIKKWKSNATRLSREQNFVLRLTHILYLLLIII